jgi:hypothetical protein
MSIFRIGNHGRTIEVPSEELAGLYVDGEYVCCECATEAEKMNSMPCDLQERAEYSEDCKFKCDRCGWTYPKD